MRCNIHLAVITVDGLLSLTEPVDPEEFDDWKELDQINVCGECIAPSSKELLKSLPKQPAKQPPMQTSEQF
jgi:hypothetical protein